MARTKRLLTGGELAALAAPALLIAAKTPALAHHTVVQQGRDMASVSADHRRGSVCDREVDDTPSTESFSQAFEPSESGTAATEAVTMSSWSLHEVIKQVQVCENTKRGTGKDACGRWEFTHPWGSNVSSVQ